MRRCDRPQLLLGLGEGDVEHSLAARHGFAQDLKRERGLPRARHTLDQVEPMWDQASAHDVVETGNAGRDGLLGSR